MGSCLGRFTQAERNIQKVPMVKTTDFDYVDLCVVGKPVLTKVFFFCIKDLRTVIVGVIVR